MLALKPLTADDCALVTPFIRHMTLQDLRFRFGGAVKMDQELACARLLTIQPDRDTVVAVLDPTGAMIAEARLVQLDYASADLAVMVRSDLKGQGIGAKLMAWLIDEAGRQGLTRLQADILDENRPMRHLARRFGFRATGRNGVFIQVELNLLAAVA